MNDQQFQILCNILLRQAQALEAIAQRLESLEQAQGKPAPDYQFDIGQFKNFDWGQINATIEKRDQYGAAIVLWRGRQYLRRSPQNKYSPAIWFSRKVGGSYERLATFKPAPQVDAIARQAEAML